jgi:ribA/ribD-fused uncharacterized protein
MLPLRFRFRWIGWLACLLAVGAGAAPVAGLRLIGMQVLPAGRTLEGVVIGGLSGLDYDPASDRWIAISDDRSERGPARAYVLRLDYDAQQFRAAEVESHLVLRQPDGRVYPDRAAQATRGGEIADFESLRLDPADGSLWYASEGDRALGLQPFVRHATREGKYLGDLALPGRFRFPRDGEGGPRANLVFEGLGFAPDGASLWVALEAPPAADGPLPTMEHGAVTPIMRLARDGRVLAEAGYPLDPIPAAPGAGRFADNGVSEVLATDDGGLLVLERSGVQGADGVFRFHVRLYAAEAVEPGPMRKRLLVNFDRLRAGGADNLEGLSWGRKLPNGHATLVLVADDNFNSTQSAQIWVFEVLPEAGTAAAPKPQRRWDDFFEGVVHDDKRIAGFVGPYGWLSNYYECPVSYEGRAYGSSEAAYHASKFPESERDEFTKLDPDASKKLSRKKTLDQAWWDARKERVMREIMVAKFTQNPGLARQLLDTGDRELEELNWWGDKFWGTVKGEGRNVLGKILMDVRAGLRTRQK